MRSENAQKGGAEVPAGAAGRPTLLVERMCTDIGVYEILRDVSFVVPRGSVTMLMGRNGAGKTTTLRSLIGHLRPKSGTVTYEGVSLVGKEPADIAAMGVAYVPENMGIFAGLTVAEHLLLAARHARTPKDIEGERLDWIFSLFPPLKKFWETPAGLLSGGQKQMVAIARGIFTPKSLLIADEPSKGLAPAIVERLIEALRAVQAQGTSVLLVEQNLQFAETLGDQVAVMDSGSIVHQGSMRDFAADDELQQQFLGLSL